MLVFAPVPGLFVAELRHEAMHIERLPGLDNSAIYDFGHPGPTRQFMGTLLFPMTLETSQLPSGCRLMVAISSQSNVIRPHPRYHFEC